MSISTKAWLCRIVSRPQFYLLAAVAAVSLAGCGLPSGPLPNQDPDLLIPTAAERVTAKQLVEARPYEMKLPSGVPAAVDPAMPAPTAGQGETVDQKKLWPLLIVLHGYGATGIVQDLLFGMSAERDRHGYIIAMPDGLRDKTGKQFWNATDVCCDFDPQKPDDVSYIEAIILDIATKYRIDKKRVFLMGHSNGGFMSYRMACDRANRIAAFVSLAGANYSEMSNCRPSEPVAALQVHGDKDDAVPIDGGIDGTRRVPSARDSVAFWAGRGECAEGPRPGEALDLETNLPGAETTVTKWVNCRRGGAELWVMRDATHVPSFKRPDWANFTWAWLSSHPKQ